MWFCEYNISFQMLLFNNKKQFNKGFTFAELIVGVAVFSVIVVSVYNAYMSILNVISTSKAKIDAIDLANEQIEIVRNLPYADVGISGGIPNGKLLHTETVVRDSTSFVVTKTIRNIDDPFDGVIGGTPNDISPSDYKLIEIEINCATCKNFNPMVVTGRIAPKNLESAATEGALFVRVFDANGNPVPDANVHVENNIASPHITIDDVTNNQGMFQLVGVPPGTNAYEITVTKSGYTTDKTYAISVSNPNPTKPHATVALQQVTQLSFVIDRTSSFAISSVTDSCSQVSNVDFSIAGNKTIGSSPTVLKYNQNKVTDSNGLLTLPNMEWDTYAINNIDASYDLVGINPPSPVSLSPNTTQNLQLIVKAKNPNTLLVNVKDSATMLPLSGVTVTLSKAGYTNTKITGLGFLGQTDWSGGSGQGTSTNATKYFSSDGNVVINNPIGDITLKKIFGEFVPSAVLESSTYDTGGVSNFQQVSWNPVDQPVGAGTPNVRVQIATNIDTYTWDYKGPDGTSGTYYTSANKNINSVHNGDRYLRYKMFLDTASTSTAPNVSDIAVTYTYACTPPGQVFFNGLSGTYDITFEKSGYVTQTTNISVSSDWQSQDIIMSPE
ncbi:MAG: hypothetical protein QG589_92 [Patescibacteria group bacterium]|nr:hypothetical protein [Patescibacteria group bacterium]